MILYQLVFAVLVAEMAVFAILVAPMPSSWRRGLLNWVAKSKLMARVAYGMHMALFIAGILFLDSLNTITSRQAATSEPAAESNSADPHHSHHHHDHHDHSSHQRAKLLLAQRNFYLTGSVMFLSAVLSRFVSMIKELTKNEEKTEASMNRHTLAQQRNQEKERLIDDLKNQIARLQAKADESARRAKDLEIVKKQAAQTADEYMRLTDKYAELERQLSGVSEGKKFK
ncbi:Endoplasmic reticulum transmembrane protein 3 [Polyrhizophydium stewartii]|uniref:Endoplasmic reticulum transmembrane protein n=1 Tax=Polyrhizophydium stewartii TaxID=2732419 RepID=A0ABR4N9J5_9FUNG